MKTKRYKLWALRWQNDFSRGDAATRRWVAARETIWGHAENIIFHTVCLLLLGLLTGCEPAATTSAGKIASNLCASYPCAHGAVIRGDTTRQELTLVFTADTFGEGGRHVLEVLERQSVQAAFFFTGNFYRDPRFEDLIKDLKAAGHYLGAHSDRHLLYCAWADRDSLLVTREQFLRDLDDNYREMARFGIEKADAPFYLPPYEWYNDRISRWTADHGLQLINYTPGTRSHADYTTPDLPNYLDSETIYQSIVEYEARAPNGLNGFLLLSHIGTDAARTDKFYLRLEKLIEWLKSEDYDLVNVEQLLS